MIVQTAGLTRRFGSVVAVDGMDLQLPAGGVIGLVGPNGSGKSTLIRMLLGLIAPSGGSAEVLGHPISEPQRYADRVGALIENPAFVAGLSARANLSALARLRGLPMKRVDEVLATVGLAGRDQEPVKRFSLGMKQRLGIAAALLPDPQLLVLDEPTNGLDPAGIVEIRGLLQALGAAGRTVIVSSHLMSEIESICTYLVIIRFGVPMGTLGLALATMTRSAGIAIGVGVGYVLLLESVLKAAITRVADWLPGTTITALASGGTTAVAYPAAVGLGIAYIVIAFTAAALVYTRRDVTD